MTRRLYFLILTFSLLLTGCSPVTPSIQALSPTTTQITPLVETPKPLTPTPSQSPTALVTIPAQANTIDFELLGVPGDYNTAQSHWSLWDLQLWHNRLYLAHGDWFNNTGPVRMMYVDLETNAFVHDKGFTVDEEAIEIFRIYNDTLYAPGTDARGGWDGGNLYRKRWGESWIKQGSIPSAIHLWDIAVLGDTLVTIGRTGSSTQSSGAIWISTDHGQSFDWGPDFVEEGYAEATSLFVLNNLLYATTVGTGCLVYDGSQWTEGDCIISDIFVGTAQVHKNAIFERSVALVPHSCVTDTHLYLFDGGSQWRVDLGEPVHDVVSTDNGFFVLSGDSTGKGSIFHASKLDCHCEQDFQRILDLDFGYEETTQHDAMAPRCSEGSTPLSLEYAQDRFYIGLADGRLFRSEIFSP